MDEVELHVLARGDVGDAIRILFCQVGQLIHLPGIQTAKWDFVALHARGIPGRFGTFGQIVAIGTGGEF